MAEGSPLAAPASPISWRLCNHQRCLMPAVEVLKFGSSVLRNPGDLHVAVDEIYRRWRSGYRILAVVSAFEGVTDELMREVTDALGSDCPEATAAYVATGEQQTGALLLGSLLQCGLPARL